MEMAELRKMLTVSLEVMSETEAVSSLTEFWQGELRVLLYLSQNRNLQINPSILSDNLNVSRSRITAALSKLREKGYVTMQMSEEDRRRMCVMLTQDGESFLKEKQAKAEGYLDTFVEGMGKDNVIELIRLIKLSTEILKNKEKQTGTKTTEVLYEH